MEAFDISVVQFVNGFVGRWPLFDRIILEIFRMSSFKMLPLVAILVGLWFHDREWGPRRRIVLVTLAGGFLALVVTRVAQNLGPHRPRPALDGRFEFNLPAGGYTNDWSSFPSDTAGLAFAIAVGIFLASRPLGILALLWAAIPVCFPRLYGGFHYPSDLLAGAAIGALCTWGVFKLRPLQAGIDRTASALPPIALPWLYAAAFVLCFQIATYFQDLRTAGERMLSAIGMA